jgi:hypothetical protein
MSRGDLVGYPAYSAVGKVALRAAEGATYNGRGQREHGRFNLVHRKAL